MRSAFAALLLLAGCGPDPAPPTPPPPPPGPAEGARTLGAALEGSPRLTTLARYVEAAGLGPVMADTSTAYTVFAPSDDAFRAAGLGLEVDSAEARAVVLAHVLSTRMMSMDVFPDLSIETLAGTEVSFADRGEGLAVVGPGGTGRIVEADLDTDNGVVHVIDTVLSPR